MPRRKAWVLDTDTKGTGAQMVPLEKVLRRPEDQPGSEKARRPGRSRPPADRSTPARNPRPRRARSTAATRQTTSTPLPKGHVRKKTTGEIGRVRSVDPKAGSASVLWLKQGRTSTVPLSALSRR